MGERTVAVRDDTFLYLRIVRIGTMKEYQNRSVLHNLYTVQKMSDREISEIFDVDHGTISYWRGKHGIESISRTERSRYRPATFSHADHEGYEKWYNGTKQNSSGGQSVRVHRLLAVVEQGFDELEGEVVHHKNGIPWDNRTENLELMTQSEHASLHKKDGN